LAACANSQNLATESTSPTTYGCTMNADSEAIWSATPIGSVDVSNGGNNPSVCKQACLDNSNCFRANVGSHWCYLYSDTPTSAGWFLTNAEQYGAQSWAKDCTQSTGPVPFSIQFAGQAWGMAKSTDNGATWTPIATIDMHTYQHSHMIGEVRDVAVEGMIIKFQPLHQQLANDLGFLCPIMHDKCDGTCTYDANRNNCFNWDHSRIFLHEMKIDGQVQDFSSLTVMESNGWDFQCRTNPDTCTPSVQVQDYNGRDMVVQHGPDWYYTYTFNGIGGCTDSCVSTPNWTIDTSPAGTCEWMEHICGPMRRGECLEHGGSTKCQWSYVNGHYYATYGPYGSPTQHCCNCKGFKMPDNFDSSFWTTAPDNWVWNGIWKNTYNSVGTELPICDPTDSPTNLPTVAPSSSPSLNPTMNPTKSPTMNPTKSPTMNPTKSPTMNPTNFPTVEDFIIKVKGFHGQKEDVLNKNKIQRQPDVDIDMYGFERKITPLSRRLLKKDGEFLG